MTTEARAFGRYELRSVLGQGGFATVYRAYDPLLAREVALKALLPHLAADADVRARFLAEARALATLHHPNIVTVFDVGETDGLPFFAMELVNGETLAARLAGGQPPREATLRWLADLASALDYLHAAGLVHRDVKPANVLVETSGRAVLMDLGIARSMDNTSHTLAGTSLGTPAYMAPEQVRGQVAGPAADIYALGILAYQLLTGRAPFSGDTAYVLHAQVYDAPPLEGLPPAVAAALAGALAKAPGDRPANATAFAAALVSAEQAVATVINPSTAQWYVPPPPPPDRIEPPQDPWRTPLPARRAGVATRALALGGGLLVVLVLFVVAISVALTRGHTNNSGVNQANTALLPTTAPTTNSALLASATTAAPPATAGAASATAGRESATAGTATASATAASQPASPAPPAAPFISPAAVTSLTIDSNALQAWATGPGALNVTASLADAPLGATLVVRISPTGALDQPVGQSAPLTLDTSNGDKIVAVPRLSGSAAPAGNYLLLAFLYGADGAWTQQTYTRGLVIAPPPAPTQPPQPAPTRATAPPVVAANGPNPPDLTFPASSVDSSRLWISDVQAAGPVSGGAFSFIVTVRNDGTATGLGSISVSSPDAQQITNSPTACGATAQDPKSFQPGEKLSIYHGANSPLSTNTASYPLGELEFSSLPAGAICSVRFTVTSALASGAMHLFLRVSTDDAGVIATWPANSGQTDQQGYPVIVWLVPAR